MTVELVLGELLLSKTTLAVIAMDRLLACSPPAGLPAIDDAWMEIHYSLAAAEAVGRELRVLGIGGRRGVELLVALNSHCCRCLEKLDLLWSLLDGGGAAATGE